MKWFRRKYINLCVLDAKDNYICGMRVAENVKHVEKQASELAKILPKGYKVSFNLFEKKYKLKANQPNVVIKLMEK